MAVSHLDHREHAVDLAQATATAAERAAERVAAARAAERVAARMAMARVVARVSSRACGGEA